MLLLSSCSFFDYSVPEKEITQSSSWGPNDQPPSYPECESLDSNEQKKCFIESIEKTYGKSNSLWFLSPKYCSCACQLNVLQMICQTNSAQEKLKFLCKHHVQTAFEPMLQISSVCKHFN